MVRIIAAGFLLVFLVVLVSDSWAVSTVKITDVSLSATEQDIREFFSFSGEIRYIEMQSGDERSQVAFVTFKQSEGAERALLLSGATIVDITVTITPATDYQLPEAAFMIKDGAESGSTVDKAENVISNVLAKGLVLGKDALDRAKSFDERHRLTSSAMTRMSSFNQKVGLSEKISSGTSAVNEKVLQMDQKYQVSEKARSAIASAEQKLSEAGTAAMDNKYVFAGVSWMIGTINKVAKTASAVGTKAVEKATAEHQQHQQKRSLVDGQSNVDFLGTPKASSSSSSPSSDHPHKPDPLQGLIL